MICLTFCMDHCQADQLYLIGTHGESMDKQKTRYKWCFKGKLRYMMIYDYFSNCSQHEDETIVVGMTNGILSVKHRKSEAKKDSLPRRRRPAYRTFIKGKNYMKQRVLAYFLHFFLESVVRQSSQLQPLESVVHMGFNFILLFSADFQIGDVIKK